MGRFYAATITPSKAELISQWAPTQPWGPAPGATVDVVGAFRYDDPDGQVGMETHLVAAQGELFQIPLTYRDAPLADSDHALVGTLEHSDLGTRWVYDGIEDPRCVMVLAAVAMTGQGEAIGMGIRDGRWFLAPSSVRVHGGGWGQERVFVDGFELDHDDAGSTVLRNDRVELTVFRRPLPGTPPAIGLTATWDGQTDPVILAAVRDLQA